MHTTNNHTMRAVYILYFVSTEQIIVLCGFFCIFTYTHTVYYHFIYTHDGLQIMYVYILFICIYLLDLV